jgi:glycolate oxidase iron-sulfur subunit
MTVAQEPKVISGLGDENPEQEPSSDAAGHRLPVLELDKRTYARSMDCVHCGLCLPACPTYVQTGLESDSPRGRIYLMKGLADGKVQATEELLGHLDLCLDCRACETACPSGVVYHELIEESRAKLMPQRPKTVTSRLLNAVFLHLFVNPTRLKAALFPARVAQKLGLWNVMGKATGPMLPEEFKKMQQMLPPDGPMWESELDAYYKGNPAQYVDGKPRAVVGMFAGCVGSVLFQEVNRQTVRILQHIGCDVVVPKAQKCCGAIHHHAGDLHGAEDLARQNIDAFLGYTGDHEKVDFIVNNISGCGAMLKDYALVLRDDDAYSGRASELVKKSKDISQLIVELKPVKPTYEVKRTVTYHDACHLAHGQKVTSQPRELLSWVKGLTVKALRESDMCCGAAGTYNLTQPAMAMELGERKVGNINKTGAGACVTGNVGCAMQISSEARRLGAGFEVEHPVSVLHEAYFGPDADSRVPLVF